MLLSDLVAVSEAVSSTRSRTRKIELLAGLLSRLTAAEARVAVSYLAGKPRQSRLGVGYATVFGVEVPSAIDPVLEVLVVDAALDAIAAASGAGSKQRRENLLEDLL
ncbi:MAG TPA: ATP-dependent DNA ligase, partial [Acidimicrobiia bacterium]